LSARAHHDAALTLIAEGRRLAESAKPLPGDIVTAAGHDVRELAALKFQEAALHIALAKLELSHPGALSLASGWRQPGEVLYDLG
jgi:hypothetical protein